MKLPGDAISYLKARRRVLWVAALVGAAVCIITVYSGFDPPVADIKYDWLVARESIRANGDAFHNILLLAGSEGVEIAVHAGPGIEQIGGHPRLPGALLLQLPLVFVPFDWLYELSIVLTALATGFIVSLLATPVIRQTGVRLLLVAFISAPLFVAVRFAGQAALVAGLTLVGWKLLQRERQVAGGTLIGMAAVLKVFPVVLIIPLILKRRWAAAISTFVTIAVANLAGLALPGVSASRALEELPNATPTWVGLSPNGSLMRWLAPAEWNDGIAQIGAIAIVIALVVGASLISRGRPQEEWRADPFLWLAAALLILPLSWISYDMVLLPPVFLMVMSSAPRSHRLGVFCLGLWIVPVAVWPIEVISSGGISTIVRGLMVVASITGSYYRADWVLSRKPPRERQPLQTVPLAAES